MLLTAGGIFYVVTSILIAATFATDEDAASFHELVLLLFLWWLFVPVVAANQLAGNLRRKRHERARERARQVLPFCLVLHKLNVISYDAYHHARVSTQIP